MATKLLNNITSAWLGTIFKQRDSNSFMFTEVINFVAFQF